MKLRSMGFVLLSILLMGMMGCAGNEEQQPNASSISNATKDGTVEEEMRSDQVKMIANDEKIIEMLKSSGAIKENATSEEIEEAVNNYLRKKAEQNKMNEKSKTIEELKKEIQKELGEEGS
ncbi:hypothetical protein [Guptibacillus hwajinpoensis]|uniref:hypothetical protein n=1 Tax=Guptibacillus hwajinpoensis TaxID=208199 RepID=UPI003734D965